ncbi:response regulator transcription factor [Alkaliphilus crotonatoxidans]
MGKRILIVDDEIDIVNMLKDYFQLNGYEVMTALDGKGAIKWVERHPDIILLDINMPDVDGIEVCSQIRNYVCCPILFLTARVEDSDKIKAFGMGGDDYIVKPFSIEELGARVAAHLRREHRQRESPKIKIDHDLVINYSERLLYFQGQAISLAKKEFDIVALLSQHQGQIFDKERIYEKIWGFDGAGDSMVVAEHIRRIRGKFTAAGMKPYIETVWGVGYKWTK